MNSPPVRNDLEDAVHVRRVNAVEVDRVRVRALVAKVHAQQVVLGRADHGPRSRAVVRPRREVTPCATSISLSSRSERVLANAAGLVRQRGRRHEERVDRWVPLDRGRLVADHRGMALRRVCVVVALVGRAEALGLRKRDPGERPGRERAARHLR